MENIIYNELIVRGYNVDVGVVEIRDKNKNRKQLEVDFVCNLGNKRYYIQSALNLDTREKTIQEERPLMNTNDNFKKIIVVKDGYGHELRYQKGEKTFYDGENLHTILDEKDFSLKSAFDTYDLFKSNGFSINSKPQQIEENISL